MNSKLSSAQQRFQKIYESGAEWQIGKPQSVVMDLCERGKFRGPILDCGCGTGDNSIYLANQGFHVVGFDFLSHPIDIANSNLANETIKPHLEFRVADALKLSTWSERFATVLDCGLYHVFPEKIRTTYIAGLHHVLARNGKLLLLCFSDLEPGTHGPLRITKTQIEDDFSNGWKVIAIERSILEFTPTKNGVSFSSDGARCWLAILERD